MDEDELRVALSAIELRGRELLRRVLIRDQADRDAIASQLLRYRDERGDDWADIIDMFRSFWRSSLSCSVPRTANTGRIHQGKVHGSKPPTRISSMWRAARRTRP